MKITKNIGTVDKMIRIFFAEVFFLVGFFWMHGTGQVVFYLLSFVMVLTTLISFCGLYTLVNINTCSTKKEFSKRNFLIASLFLVLFLIIGGYYSIFFSKKIFLEDFNRMNQYYKQTLFFTGQNNRDESVKNYENLVTEYARFYTKYSQYHPYVISSDGHFNEDIENVKNNILSLKDNVATGDLPLTHKEFEIIRPIFQDILKRNGFSMLAVSLVDFHDAMEKIISAADEKNGEAIIAVYQEVSDKLKAVEEVTNDEEIQLIRQKLERVASSARSGNKEVLPAQAQELKSSFVKVYLKRG